MRLSFSRYQMTLPGRGLFPVFLLLFFLTACGQKTSVTDSSMRTNAVSIMEDVRRSVSFGNRFAGSDEQKTQGDWLLSRFKALSRFSVREEVFTEDTPRGKVRFRNIIAELPGKSSRFVIVGAHYDIKKFSGGSFPGANDGASGVAAILAMADTLQKSPVRLPYSVRFILFDGEECLYDFTENDGLHGSRYHANRLAGEGKIRDCRAMILLDMIGDRDLCLTVPLNTEPELFGLLTKIVRYKNGTQYVREYPHEVLDDHVPFQKHGIPCIDLIDFEYGENNLWWHTDEDSPDKVSGESIKRVSDWVLLMLENLK